MTRRITLMSFGLLALLALSACPAESSNGSDAQEPNTDEVTLTINNIDAAAWYVVSVDGADDVAAEGEENANPAWQLSVGTRYRINNQGGSAHPLELLSDDATAPPLLSQADEGTFESDTEVDYKEDADGITFTLTQALADELASYICTFHSGMEGSIITE